MVVRYTRTGIRRERSVTTRHSMGCPGGGCHPCGLWNRQSRGHGQRSTRRYSGGAVTVAVAAAAVVLGLIAMGCSSQDAPSTAPSSAASPSPSSSAAVTTASPAEEAQSQAVALVPAYLRTIDDLYLDPSRPLDDLYAVAVAPEVTAEATAIGTFRSRGYRQTGRSQLVTATADSVDLTPDPAASPSPTLPTVVVTACVDVSQVQATDASGNSVIPADRPRDLVARLTIVNPHYPDASSWRGRRAAHTHGEPRGGR